jgi:hypothetical protein
MQVTARNTRYAASATVRASVTAVPSAPALLPKHLILYAYAYASGACCELESVQLS